MKTKLATLRPVQVLALARREVGLLAGFAIAAALALLFVHLGAEVTEGDTLGFDRRVLLALRNPADPADPIGPPWFEEMARDVTALGSYGVLGLILMAVLGYLLFLRQRATAFLLLASVCGGSALSGFLKTGFARARPDIVPHATRVFTESFPSGHATLSAVTFLTLGAVLARTEPRWQLKAYIAAVSLAFTVIVGMSRVYLGVHYPTDVLAGWCLGAAWALLCWSIALRLGRRVEAPAEPALSPAAGARPAPMPPGAPRG